VSTRDPDDFLYASPERLMTGGEEWQGDLFSLGATLYHLVTGRPPLAGRSPEGSVEARIAGKQPPEPRAANPGVPETLSAALMRMMSRDPEERYASYADAADALRGIEHDLSADPGKTRVARPVVRGSGGEPPRRTLTVSSPERRAADAAGKSPGTSGTVDRLLAVCLAILLVLIGWYACRRLLPGGAPEGERTTAPAE
jgi:serine/threonine protein kinase